MIALASLFGMEREEATSALSDFPQGILEKRWKKENDVVVLKNVNLESPRKSV
jgi:RNase P/RNase MRP subunit p30